MTDTAPTENTPTAAPKKHTASLQEVQDTVSRLAAHKGVLAVLILNKSGDIVTQSGGNGEGASSVGNPKLLAKMLTAANTYVLSMHDDQEGDNKSPAEKTEGEADGVDELLEATKDRAEENITFVRVRTPQDEILVAPKLGYTLVVLQDPSVSTL